MPDTPIQVSQTEHDVQALMLAQINSLSQRHVSVSYMFVGILVLVLGLAGVGGWLGLKAYENQIARAEAAEVRYVDAQKGFQTTLAQHDSERAANAKASAALIAQIAARASQAPSPIVQAGLKPGAAAVDVKNALGAVLSDRHPEGVSMAVQGENLEISPVSAQVWLADELLLNRVSADLTDTQSLLALSTGSNSSLVRDLNQCKAVSVEAQKTIDAYKAAAVKSKWKKFLDGVQKVGLLVAGVAIGRAI